MVKYSSQLDRRIIQALVQDLIIKELNLKVILLAKILNIVVNQPGGGNYPNQQQIYSKNAAQNQTTMNPIADEHRKFISENSIDNSHPHNQSYVHYNQMQQFTETGNNFNSHTMDARNNQISQIPTSILSGTYINSNIIVHQKHIDTS